jgi:hypothetical protein
MSSAPAPETAGALWRAFADASGAQIGAIEAGDEDALDALGAEKSRLLDALSARDLSRDLDAEGHAALEALMEAAQHRHAEAEAALLGAQTRLAAELGRARAAQSAGRAFGGERARGSAPGPGLYDRQG